MDAATAHNPTIRLRVVPTETTVSYALQPDTLLRLRPTAQVVQVISGCAYVSWNGEDYCLRASERLHLNASKYPALISAERDRPLVIEISAAQ